MILFLYLTTIRYSAFFPTIVVLNMNIAILDESLHIIGQTLPLFNGDLLHFVLLTMLGCCPYDQYQPFRWFHYQPWLDMVDH